MSALDSLRTLGTQAGAYANQMLESYLATRIDSATQAATSLEAAHPNATASERVKVLTERKAKLNGALGAAVGAVMLMPGGSGMGRLVMIVGDMAGASVSSIDLVLTTAALHGYRPADATEARRWLLETLTAPDDLTHHVTAPLPLKPEERAAALANAPLPAALTMKGQVPVRIALLTMPEAEEGTPFRDWKMWFPVLLGTVMGAYVDFKTIRGVGEKAERFFGPIDEEDREAMEQRVEDLERLLDHPDDQPAG